jgi:single-strand DNA-binding protein
MNKIILIGGLIADPTIKKVNESKIATFTLGVSEGKDKAGLSVSSFHVCKAFSKLADVIEKYVKKGHKIMVVGRVKYDTWDKPDGTKGHSTNIMVLELEMLTTKAEAEKMEGRSPSPQAENPQAEKVSNIELSEFDALLGEVDKTAMPF